MKPSASWSRPWQMPRMARPSTQLQHYLVLDTAKVRHNSGRFCRLVPLISLCWPEIPRHHHQRTEDGGAVLGPQFHRNTFSWNLTLRTPLPLGFLGLLGVPDVKMKAPALLGVRSGLVGARLPSFLI